MAMNPVEVSSGVTSPLINYNDKSDAIVQYWKGKLEAAVQSSVGPHWIGVHVLNPGIKKSEDMEGAFKVSRQEVIFYVSGPIPTPSDNPSATLATLLRMEKIVKFGGLGVDFVGEGPAGDTLAQQALDVCEGIRDLNE